ncbi:flavodoxin family protein [Geoglobus acetivorans]|uniref:Iron-sulfur flavoprotein n=1 Tax=Geoglobus acetivorans TaxID=565033 RepID=A0A0A7GF79_GEOAI|nr:Iron-sulfur flavoprotein [Geoglobus acetivorans]
MILGICGSPRKKATHFVLERALEMLEEMGYETEFFTVRGKKINFCTHCDYCLKHKKCVFSDDVSELYELIEKADGLILATPTYNSGVSAQLKAIMDRTRAILAKDPNILRGKVGMGIAVGGDRMGGQEIALLQIHAFFILNGVIPAGGGAYGANLGATFWSKDTLEGVMEDEEGFRSLKKTIKKFAKFIAEYRTGKVKSA